jgi:hypothetical protein
MAIDATHWTVDRQTGDIRYTGPDHGIGGETYATVIQFHRWLGELADDAVSAGDDELDITDELPSQRSTNNIITLLGVYNIDANASEHLFDGTVTQGAVGVDQIIYDGIVNFGNADVQIQIIQDGAVLADDWWNEAGAGLNPDSGAGISHRFMIKTHDFVGDGGDIDGRRLIGTSRTFGNVYAEFSINGTSRGNNVLALGDTADLNNETVEGTVSGWTGITNTTEGYALIDVNNDTTDEPYYSEWDANLSTRTINDFYERMKWLTRDGSASTIYGLNGELFRGVTHEIAIGSPSGTFAAFEAVTWSGGTGQMLAIDSTTAGTKMWIQLLTGAAPTNTQTITGSGTAVASGAATSRPISIPFIGASTGSALIGAYGVGVETNDLKNTDKVTDLGTNLRTPPNNVTFTVGGLIADEDQVIVGPWDGSSVDNEGNPAIDTAQLGTGLTVILDADDITTVTVGAGNIPLDTPSPTGYIRVVDDLGFARRLHYTAWENTGGTFTVDTSDGQEDFSGDEAAIGNDVWIAYIDSQADSTPVVATALSADVEYIIVTTGTTDFTAIGAADSNPGTVFTATGAGTGTGTAKPRSTSAAFTGVYNTDRDLVVIVRDGKASPIKQFISSAVFGGSDTTITAIRTTDE